MTYLDHNATSPLRPQVLEGMLPYFTERAGNPSSVHGAGRTARQGVDEARRRVAALLNVHDSQVMFTSGGTEANNTVIWGSAARGGFRGHIITSTVEHPSILRALERVQNYGVEVTKIGVDSQGVLQPDAVLSAIRPDTQLVSILHANNETGVVQPLAEIGKGCREAGIPLHTDAVQSVGKIPVRFETLAVDFLTLSAHKWGGPQGIGALIVGKRASVIPLLVGGGQERGRRSGTENVPAIVGFGWAAEMVHSSLVEEGKRLCKLRNYLEETIKREIPNCTIFGQQAENRLPNTTALAIQNMEGETLVMNLDLDGFSVSSGSACSSGRTQPSHVPMAMGHSAELAKSIIRVSLGWNTTQEDVERFVAVFLRIIQRLRNLASPIAEMV